ncbi:MAG: efflux RND transporter periplasmic adaptor subunit [Candidatus Accumulibacter sp.]|jgi:membrane fusion protein (multidrug efflux system)|nr:efflux RND transporter periplasmic adaptor subunit [Accumulibacter sp.]
MSFPLNLFRWSRFGVILTVPALFLSACSDRNAPPETPPVPVTILEVKPVNLPAVIEIVGQMEGAKETEVRPRVGGILVKRLYTEGSNVQAGQPLFQIDKAPYLNALAESRARAQQTAREEARMKGLLEHNAVSRKEYDDAASANAMAQAALEQAKLNLSWTTVVAPVSGVSGRSARSEGNLTSVNDQMPLTTISQSSLVWVRFGLSESDIASLPGGRIKEEEIKRVELLLPDGRVYSKQGKINFFASTIDTVLGTRQLRAEFDNSENELLPGQFVRVRLTTGDRDGVFLVPQSAVVQTELARLVMLADAQSKVAPRPVVAAEWHGSDWVILHGLKAGDRVIVDNLMKLRPGASVALHGPKIPPAEGGQPAANPPGTARQDSSESNARETSGAAPERPAAQK